MNKEKQVMLNVLKLYKDMPYLWDKHNINYKNKTVRNEGYSVLLSLFKSFDESATFKTLKKKIDNYKTNYARESRKVKESKHTGDKDVYVPTLWYYDTLSFLESTTEACRSVKDAIENEATSGDPNSGLPTQETNEEPFERNSSDSRTTLNNSSSLYNNSELSQCTITQSTNSHKAQSKKPLQQHIRQLLKRNSRSTRKHTKQAQQSTQLHHKKRLNRLERVSSELNLTQYQPKLHAQDEFYFFGLSVAAQLRNLPLPIAVKTQSTIQNTLSAARLSSMVSKTPSPRSSSNCTSPVCDQSSYSTAVQETANADSETYIKIEENCMPFSTVII